MKCIKCGSTTPPFIGLLCLKCYKPHIKIPKKIEIKQCKKCGRLFFSGKWQSKQKLNSFLKSKVKGSDVKRVEIEDNMYKIYITDDAFVKRKIPIIFVPSICDTCSKISGGYYEAIVQLRDKGLRYYNRLLKLLNKRTFISKIDDSNGYDIYVGSSKELFSILSYLKIKHYNVSKKLYGLKEGKRVYRITIVIRS